jgi:hypothetical protein
VNSKEFTEKYLLKEVQLIEAANVRLHLLLALVHGVETAGALLDEKPFKAKGQGKKRFALALRKLFPTSYSDANSSSDLYNILRSHMAHCMLPAKQILLTQKSVEHLVKTDNGIQIHLNTFYQDYLEAMKKLVLLIESNHVKPKRIEFDNLQQL